jgi:O-antigen/teichoic acid export membrane protein
MSSAGPETREQDTSGSAVHFGLKWMTISMVAARSARFLTTIVLARLLAKEMFGLIAMANAVVNILVAMREIGFGQAFIHRQEKNEEEVRIAANTTFVLTLAINCILLVVGYLLVPSAVAFFKDADALGPVLQVILLAFLVDALLATHTFVLQKKLEFGRLSTAEIIGSVSNAVVAITMALLGFGVWSLVAGQLSSRVIQTIVLARLSGWSPRLEFSGEIARQLFRYGKYLWAFSALGAIGGVADRLTVGHLLGPGSVGVYGLAFTLCSMPATQIAYLVNRVTFPALARKQGDPEALRRAVLKAVSHLSIVALPMAMGLFAISRELVPALLGSKWRDAVPLVDIFAFYGLSLAIAAPGAPALKAIGKPNVMLHLSVLHHVVMFGLLFSLARFGIEGVAYAILIPMVLTSLLNFSLLSHYLELGFVTLWAPVLRAAVPAGIMYAVLEGARRALAATSLPDAVIAVSLLLVGVATYVVASFVTNGAEARRFQATMREVFAARSAPA